MIENKTKGGSYIASGITGLTIVGLAWIEARSFPLQGLQEGLGAAFFPYLVLGVIALLGIALIIHGITLGFHFALPFEPGSQLPATAKLFAVFVVFTVAFAFFGLLIPAILFLVLAMRILGASWKGAGVTGTAAGCAIYAIFVLGFGVPMP